MSGPPCTQGPQRCPALRLAEWAPAPPPLWHTSVYPGASHLPPARSLGQVPMVCFPGFVPVLAGQGLPAGEFPDPPGRPHAGPGNSRGREVRACRPLATRVRCIRPAVFQLRWSLGLCSWDGLGPVGPDKNETETLGMLGLFPVQDEGRAPQTDSQGAHCQLSFISNVLGLTLTSGSSLPGRPTLQMHRHGLS